MGLMWVHRQTISCQELRSAGRLQGESGGGGLSQAYYRAYVNRYYSGVNCQDIGPAVAIGASSGLPFHDALYVSPVPCTRVLAL